VDTVLRHCIAVASAFRMVVDKGARNHAPGCQPELLAALPPWPNAAICNVAPVAAATTGTCHSNCGSRVLDFGAVPHIQEGMVIQSLLDVEVFLHIRLRLNEGHILAIDRPLLQVNDKNARAQSLLHVSKA
jgi:hypothetical protein